MYIYNISMTCKVLSKISWGAQKLDCPINMAKISIFNFNKAHSFHYYYFPNFNDYLCEKYFCTTFKKIADITKFHNCCNTTHNSTVQKFVATSTLWKRIDIQQRQHN